MTMNQAHALARDEISHAITVFSGWATADGLIGGTTIIDTKLIGVNDFLAGKAILIMSGPCAWEMKTATSFVPGTGTITTPPFSARITAGTLYRILTVGASGGGGIYTEQADTPVFTTAPNGSETNIFLLNAANTRYMVQGMRLKCANPAGNTVTVRLYELINDTLTEVDSFAIDATNWTVHHSLMDMFGVPHLAGTQIKVTVRASAGGPYGVIGQYSASKAAI